jgi:hypothetical protein
MFSTQYGLKQVISIILSIRMASRRTTPVSYKFAYVARPTQEDIKLSFFFYE